MNLKTWLEYGKKQDALFLPQEKWGSSNLSRTKKQQPQPQLRPQPMPAPRTKIMELSKALKGYTKSYEIAIKNDKDILEQYEISN